MSRLAATIRKLTAGSDKLSGVLALPDGEDSFAARVILAEAAEQTLDVQYYIWRTDRSGLFLFDCLRRAADRGVKVRLLLDDSNSLGLDFQLSSLDAHPNIAVRLFNPFKIRQWRILDILRDFSRLNRRMHNKSFTVDGVATILGGRNVGDEYFGAGKGVDFVDLDVLAVGPAAADVSADFERYWTSVSAQPTARLLPALTAAVLMRIRRRAARRKRLPESALDLGAFTDRPFAKDLAAGRLALEWVPARLLSDDPEKVRARAHERTHLWKRLPEEMGRPRKQLDLVTPYFIPTVAGVDAFSTLAKEGVRIRVLTNSLAATDHGIVHAGYAKYRKALLESGVELYEMKRAYSVSQARSRRRRRRSASSLHAKTISVDGERIFVGSFNFDPRSAQLNTEMGLVFDSSSLALGISQRFETELADRVYRVRPGEKGRLFWIERADGVEIRHDVEPDTTLMQRVAVAFLAWLPIEWLL